MHLLKIPSLFVLRGRASVEVLVRVKNKQVSFRHITHTPQREGGWPVEEEKEKERAEETSAVRVFAVEPDFLSSVPRTHVVEGEN